MRRDVYDVCAVGHITRDRVRIEDQVREQSGGAAYYLSLVLRRLGRQVAVVTKMAPADELLLLTELKTEKIDVSCLYSATTTTFENIYPRRNSDLRVHKVSSVAGSRPAASHRRLRRWRSSASAHSVPQREMWKTR